MEKGGRDGVKWADNGMVRHWFVHIFRGERGKVGEADRGGSGGRGERGADGLHLSKVGDKVISCEGGRGWRGGRVRREDNMENSFLGLEAEEFIFVR